MYHHHTTTLIHLNPFTDYYITKDTIFKKNYSADAKTILVTSGTTTNIDIIFMNTSVQENTNE